MVDDIKTKLPRPAADATAAQLWEYIDHKEEREQGFWAAFEHLQTINRDLAKHVSVAQARERDHRRKVIELAACYAINKGGYEGLSVEAATARAVQVGFLLWDRLDQRFKREQQERQGDVDPSD